MSRGTRKHSGRLMGTAVLLVVVGLLTALVGGCGGSEPANTGYSTAVDTGTPSPAEQPSAEGEGVLLAKEILSTFDELVAEVAGLSEDKPDAAVLKPLLEQLYESYVPKMAQLNERYLALRASSDVVQFGECNSYLGSNRGRHVADKDNLLSPALRYYNFELGDQEMVSLLSDGPVELLNLAVDQG